MLDPDLRWNWRGNMLVGVESHYFATQEGESASPLSRPSVEFEVWVPGMLETKSCRVSPELPEGEIIEPGTQMDVTGTFGDPVMAAITYVTMTQSQGLNPQSANHYVQIFDPTSCSLGDQMKLQSIRGDAAQSRRSARFYASGRTTVIAKSFLGLDDPDVFVAVDLEDRDIPYALPEVGLLVFQLGTEYMGLQDWSTYNSTFDDLITELINIDSGEQVSSFVAAAEFGSQVGPDQIFSTPPRAWWQVGSSPLVTQGPYHSEGAVVWAYSPTEGYRSFAAMSDSEQDCRTVLGGMAMPDHSLVVVCDSDHGISWIDNGQSLNLLLASDEIEALDFQVHGMSNGRLYVSTTAEKLIIGLDGEVLGSWEDWHPVETLRKWSNDSHFEERVIYDVLHTVWQNSDEELVLMINGAEPEPSSTDAAGGTKRSAGGATEASSSRSASPTSWRRAAVSTASSR